MWSLTDTEYNDNQGLGFIVFICERLINNKKPQTNPLPKETNPKQQNPTLTNMLQVLNLNYI